MRQTLTYQVVFILNFLVSYFVMKVVSWYCTSPQKRGSAFLFFTTPYISVRSLRYKKKDFLVSYFFHFLVFSLMTIMTLLLALQLLLPLNYGKTLLLAPAIYFLTEAMGSMGQLIFSWSKKSTISIHHRPLFSSCLSQFWGRNWNVWVQDWLKDVARLFPGTKTTSRLMITFAFSGFFHEVMVNLPYWLVYRKSYFGTMMLYFIIQSLGLMVDKKYVRKYHPLIQKAYMWLVLVLPSPLFINVPLTTFLGIKNA